MTLMMCMYQLRVWTSNIAKFTIRACKNNAVEGCMYLEVSFWNLCTKCNAHFYYLITKLYIVMFSKSNSSFFSIVVLRHPCKLRLERWRSRVRCSGFTETENLSRSFFFFISTVLTWGYQKYEHKKSSECYK